MKTSIDDGAGTRRGEHPDEDDVEEAEQEQRQQHPELETPVAGEDRALLAMEANCSDPAGTRSATVNATLQRGESGDRARRPLIQSRRPER